VLERRQLAPHAVAHWASQAPEQVALEHVDGRTRTYAELHTDATNWAAAFSRAGIDQGTHVGTFFPNELWSHRSMLALGWLRSVEVPVNAGFKAQMLTYALNQADVTHLVTSVEYLGRVAAVAADLLTLESVIVVDAAAEPALPSATPSSNLQTVALGDVLADSAPAPELPGPDVDDIACIMYTSGTTGPSKAVICPWGLVHQMWSWVPQEAMHPGTGVFNPLPLFHNSGRSGFNYTVANGCRFVTRDRFSATAFWADIRRHDCGVAALVGPMTSLLFIAPEQPDDADNPLHTAVLGPMIPDMEAFETRFETRVCTCYGQTEIGSPVTTGYDHGPWANTGQVRTDYPHPEVRLVDTDNTDVAVGEVGEMIVRTEESGAFNAGYYGMPEETAAAWRDGWFHTGDGFRCDSEGRFYFVDRMKDTIRRRGENISSFEVEKLVLEHPEVVECAAIGIPTELGDDELMAAVILADNSELDPSGVVAFLEPLMPAFMLPRYVEVFEDFPRNETTGRVRKTELRKRGVTGSTWDRELR
jgi:crotonobetaine/carnitine-CoA ligase